MGSAGNIENGHSDYTNNEDGKNGETIKALEEVMTFEDLLEVVVGTQGRWNLLLFVLCCYSTFVSPFQTLSYQFLGATPDYWCQVAPLVDAKWTKQQILQYAIPVIKEGEDHDGCHMYDRDYSQAATVGYQEAVTAPSKANSTYPPVIACGARDFDLSVYQSTVTIEWDLVCERRALYSTTQAAAQVGKLLGYLVLGFLLDWYGRRVVVLWSAVGCVLFSYGSSFMPNVWLFIIFRVAITVATSGIYLGCFVTLMETCSPKQRSKVGTMFVLPWALGYMILPGVAYGIRSWRWLQAAVSCPSLLLVAYYWLLPESPRWLILHGRHSEALEVLRKGAAINGRSLPPDHHMLAAMNRINDKKDDGTSVGELATKLVKLFKVRELRNRSFIVFYCWFAAALVYYGVAFSGTNLSSNVYMYIFLGGLLEVPSYILLWPAIVFFGRVKSLAGLYLICALSILLVTIIIVFVPHAPEQLTITLSLVGKMAITAGFHLIWMFTAELFPTHIRSFILGLSSFCGRIGSTASPYINDLLGEMVVWAPSCLFGVIALVAGGISFLLPETKGKSMPEENDFGDNKKAPVGGVLNQTFTLESGEGAVTGGNDVNGSEGIVKGEKEAMNRSNDDGEEVNTKL